MGLWYKSVTGIPEVKLHKSPHNALCNDRPFACFKIGVRMSASLFNTFHVLELLIMLFVPETIADRLI